MYSNEDLRDMGLDTGGRIPKLKFIAFLVDDVAELTISRFLKFVQHFAAFIAKTSQETVKVRYMKVDHERGRTRFKIIGVFPESTPNGFPVTFRRIVGPKEDDPTPILHLKTEMLAIPLAE